MANARARTFAAAGAPITPTTGCRRDPLVLALAAALDEIAARETATMPTIIEKPGMPR